MIKHLWLVIFLQGLLALALGIICVLWPVKTLLAVTWFTGAFLLIESIIAIVIAFWPGDKHGLTGILVLEGIIGLVFALLIMAWPALTLNVLFLGLGIWAVAVGLVGIVKVVLSKHPHHVNEPNLFSSLFKLLVGFLLLSQPVVAVSLVEIFLGFFLIILGLGTTIYALKYKSFLD